MDLWCEYEDTGRLIVQSFQTGLAIVIGDFNRGWFMRNNIAVFCLQFYATDLLCAPDLMGETSLLWSPPGPSL
jgi:hypothetical protein